MNRAREQISLSHFLNLIETHFSKYYTDGSISIQDSIYTVKVVLHDAKTGKIITEHLFEGADVFDIVDNITLQLKHDLGFSKTYLEHTRDLPVAEMYTKSDAAIKAFSKYMYTSYVELNFWQAEYYLQDAVEEDDSFALALILLAGSKTGSEAQEYFNRAMSQIHKLPLGLQYQIKAGYYEIIDPNPEKKAKMIKLWSQTIPYDFEAHESLADIYLDEGEYKAAISELEIAYKLNPNKKELLYEIGNVFLKMGKHRKAKQYYSKVLQEKPDDYNSMARLGDLSSRMGDLEEALTHYEHALTISPRNTTILRKIGTIEARKNQWDSAKSRMYSALKLSSSARDSFFIAKNMVEIHKWLGKRDSALLYNNILFELTRQHNWRMLFEIPEYFGILGDVNSAIEAIDYAIVESPPVSGVDTMLLFHRYSEVYKHIFEADSIRNLINHFYPNVFTGNFHYYNWELENTITQAMCFLYEFEGDIDAAIDCFEDYPFTFEICCPDEKLHLGLLYMMTDECQKSESIITDLVDEFPHIPSYRYSLAKMYYHCEQYRDAAKHLNIALDIWKDADPDYQPAQEAHELRRKLEMRN